MLYYFQNPEFILDGMNVYDDIQVVKIGFSAGDNDDINNNVSDLFGSDVANIL